VINRSLPLDHEWARLLERKGIKIIGSIEINSNV
jgi:hypothetical protein